MNFAAFAGEAGGELELLRGFRGGAAERGERVCGGGARGRVFGVLLAASARVAVVVVVVIVGVELARGVSRLFGELARRGSGAV